jgi:hypothetical protein
MVSIFDFSDDNPFRKKNEKFLHFNNDVLKILFGSNFKTEYYIEQYTYDEKGIQKYETTLYPQVDEICVFLLEIFKQEKLFEFDGYISVDYVENNRIKYDKKQKKQNIEYVLFESSKITTITSLFFYCYIELDFK